MAGKITALRLQKRSERRVNVYLDGEFAFGLADIAAYPLRVGDWLSDEKITDLQETDSLERARDKALSYLAYRPRSTWELQRYLNKREFLEPVVSQVLAHLQAVGLVDDLAFARYWIENRAQFRPRGALLLRQELRQKGIAGSIVDEALQDYDEVAALQRVAHKQARRLRQLPPEEFRQRLTQRLVRRGFSYESIRDVITDFIIQSEGDL
ncbi:MAG: RecX family transcriptional regulator [Chloroflexota bacterium]|nr:RecX family transcriptional regulator [Chloroflexota bacterium]